MTLATLAAAPAGSEATVIEQWLNNWVDTDDVRV